MRRRETPYPGGTRPADSRRSARRGVPALGVSSTQPAGRVDGLRKSYGSTRAVDGISCGSPGSWASLAPEVAVLGVLLVIATAISARIFRWE
jgi:hypothetical protein